MRTIWKGLCVRLWHRSSLTVRTSTSSAVLFRCTILMMIGRHCCIGWSSWGLDMPYRALHLPCCCLGWVGLNASSNRRVVATSRSRATFDIRCHSLSYNTLAKIAVSLEDFFGRDVGTILEEAGVVENRLKILGNLTMSVWPKRMRPSDLTSHITSLYAIKEATASIAKKLSSMLAVFVFGYKMFGVMTVAKL